MLSLYTVMKGRGSASDRGSGRELVEKKRKEKTTPFGVSLMSPFNLLQVPYTSWLAACMSACWAIR